MRARGITCHLRNYLIHKDPEQHSKEDPELPSPEDHSVKQGEKEEETETTVEDIV